MAKKNQNQLLFWIKAAFIGASLPLLLSHQSWAKDCTKTEINSNIEQFKDKDSKKVDAALDAVVNCGDKAIALLELALSESESAIRANAASASEEKKEDSNDASFFEKNAVWLASVGVVLLYLGVFWFNPIFLLKLDDLVKSVEVVEIPQVNFKVPLSRLLLLKYHPRVLDAWVVQRIKTARKTVNETELHESQAVNLEGKEVKAEEFKEIEQQKIGLVIWVEGGAKKTSLACQMEKWAMWGRTDEEEKDSAQHLCDHRMLPIFIDDDLDHGELLKTIERKLRVLTGETKEISPELVEQLLKQQRILVIVDRLLELSEATRKAIYSEVKTFAVNALVINLIEGKLENKEVYEISKIEEFFNYHPWVLDTWVAEHLDRVQSHFLAQPTVIDRAIHIPIQIKLGKKLYDPLTPQYLRPAFSDSPTCLMIVGEGGVGKTSLAYQIARWGMGMVDEETAKGESLCSHRMLPVTIEQELENTTLLAAIQNQLPRTPEGNFIDDELLKALLKRQRVLVILDHVSEMSSKQTYKQMKEALNETPVNALIITSRLKEKDLGRSGKTLLEPQKIKGTRLSTFIQPYLEARGKKDIFEDDAEFYRTCTRLATMMAATLQSATALLVRMYVDRVIEVGGLKTALLPDDIPTLMLQYLESLNRAEAIDREVRQDDSMVLQTAKAVAWICLRDNYYPTEARYEDVIRAIAALSPAENPQQDARQRLTYLEQTLRLVKRAENRVQIILDPVAEYLAAFKVVAICQQQGEEPWQEFFPTGDTEPEQEIRETWERFFQTVDAKPDLDQIQGFLLAVYNCYRREGKNLSGEVLEKLEQRAKLDPEELEQVRRRQRINRLIDELDAPEPEYRLSAVRDLGAMGKDATKAIPRLYRVLEKDSKAEIRLATLKALTQLDKNANRTDPSLRKVFENGSEKLEIRLEAFKVLNQLGADVSRIPIVKIKADVCSMRLIEAPEIVKINLGNGVTLDMVSIPSGKFSMGSPENIEKPQHEVIVQPFLMGKYPITQAQYQQVMDKKNPSYFKGDDQRPVEKVSWDDAAEFCQRLSEKIGQIGIEYRLPSEAEWEYACRAGTTTLYHFGDTLKDKLANYGRNVDETTSVGQFPPNAFGLYDMHGNVWEWCEDDWHRNYQGAPNDGKAWVSGESNSKKILRGGSWYVQPGRCRSASRYYLNRRVNRVNHIGFRVVYVVPRTT